MFFIGHTKAAQGLADATPGDARPGGALVLKGIRVLAQILGQRCYVDPGGFPVACGLEERRFEPADNRRTLMSKRAATWAIVSPSRARTERTL